jgi:methylmalonyl-CoA mutase N-terminal domain/subunit
MGGMIPAIEKGFPQSEIAQASFDYQRAVENSERIIVGVNAFTNPAEEPIDLLQIDETAPARQQEKLEALRRRRDNGQVRRALDSLRRAASGSENTMPHIIQAVVSYATLGEICDALRDVFGTWQETAVL